MGCQSAKTASTIDAVAASAELREPASPGFDGVDSSSKDQSYSSSESSLQACGGQDMGMGPQSTNGAATSSRTSGLGPLPGPHPQHAGARGSKDCAPSPNAALFVRKPQRSDTRTGYMENTGSPIRADLLKQHGPGATYRPHRIVLVRHGESEGNVDRKLTSVVPDHALHLTAKGRQEALQSGVRLKELIEDETVAFIISPYVRTQETFAGIARAFGPVEELSVRQDVQVRELEHGNFDRDDMKDLHTQKSEFGAFFYRFADGESCADVYDRCSMFIEALYRRWEFSREQNLVIVSHGHYLLVFLMRFFRYTVDEYYVLDALKNCEMIVLEQAPGTAFYDIEFTWCVGLEKDFGGLRKKPELLEKKRGRRNLVWDGDPDADLIVSQATKGTFSKGKALFTAVSSVGRMAGKKKDSIRKPGEGPSESAVAM